MNEPPPCSTTTPHTPHHHLPPCTNCICVTHPLQFIPVVSPLSLSPSLPLSCRPFYFLRSLPSLPSSPSFHLILPVKVDRIRFVLLLSFTWFQPISFFLGQLPRVVCFWTTLLKFRKHRSLYFSQSN